MSGVIERDVKVKLAAWGAWTRNSGSCQGYSSPAQALINCAPVCDSDYKRRARYEVFEHISDEDALEVERAMATLKRYSARLDVALGHMLEHELEDDNLLICVLMYPVLNRYYKSDDSLRCIASQLTKDLGRKITHVKVQVILERGIGFIDGRLAA